MHQWVTLLQYAFICDTINTYVVTPNGLFAARKMYSIRTRSIYAQKRATSLAIVRLVSVARTRGTIHGGSVENRMVRSARIFRNNSAGVHASRG